MANERILAEMRRIIQDYFPDEISFYTTTTTYDRYGNPTTTSGLVTTVHGQISAPTGNEIDVLTALRDEGILAEETVKVKLPYGTPVTINQRAVTSGNLAWDVVFVSTPQTFTAVTEAILTRKIINGKQVR